MKKSIELIKNKNILGAYFDALYYAGRDIETTLKGSRKIEASKAFYMVAGLIKRIRQKNKKIIFIGNGGSASIASHQAVDYWKNGHIKAIAFNDSSLLTCISNDYGYENVFSTPMEKFADKGDLLFAISSSGGSKNILNGVKAAKKKRCFIVTLSGFSSKNPLRKSGDINFYVRSDSYGIVEITHLAICHSILDYILLRRTPRSLGRG